MYYKHIISNSIEKANMLDLRIKSLFKSHIEPFLNSIHVFFKTKNYTFKTIVRPNSTFSITWFKDEIPHYRLLGWKFGQLIIPSMFGRVSKYGFSTLDIDEMEIIDNQPMFVSLSARNRFVANLHQLTKIFNTNSFKDMDNILKTGKVKRFQ